MRGAIVQPDPLDREAALRKQVFFQLSQMEKCRDGFSLIEMNGERCASRQMFRLQAYDRPQRKLVGGGTEGFSQ